MSVEIKVPMLPESVSDATVMDWHIKAGSAVRRDQNLVDLETEKVVLEVPAPDDGVLKEIRKQPGDTVTSGEILAILEPGTQAAPPAPAAEPEAAEPPASETNPADERLSPAVRHLVAEHELDPAKLTGTGKDGRLTKEDVLNYLEQQSASKSESEQPASTTAALLPTPPAATGERGERRESMTRLRRTIAARLVQAQQSAAILTTFNEVDLSAVMTLRKQYKDAFEKTHGARLGFMSFFVKASVEALRRFPAVNAYIDGTDVVYHNYCDIGIAVSSPRGLVVPVVRDAERHSFAEIEAAIAGYGDKARKGTLSMDDLTGGTFTITNGGVFGSLLSTPILNPPQSAILGMHKIQDRPMAVDGEVVIRPMMYLALSYDHRIVDGREAVSFLVTVKDMLEQPARLLLEV